jgi:phospholipid/cholesterol/gamma-HCH transport system substrate-binding protein
MASAKRERVFVGLFVIVATVLLILTVFSMSGFFEPNQTNYRTYFKNAGGLGPGSEVRYAGGPPIGRVTSVRSDPADPTHMEVLFRVGAEVPVKTDSKARISSLGALGENFLGIVPGTAVAPRAPAGAVLASLDYVGFDELTANVNTLAPQATQLLQTLNSRAVDLRETIARVDDLLNATNRANISATMANLRGMIEEDRPVVHSTLERLNDTSAKLGPLLDDFKKTAGQANEAISHIDATLTENRPDLRASLEKLHETLDSASSLADQLNRIMLVNSDNLDETLENLRHITENLKEFTDTIKTRPYTLIRASAPPPRQPGGAKP